MYLPFENLKTNSKKVHSIQKAKNKKSTADIFSC